MAAASPTAVATRASAIPGATASILPPPLARPAKESIIPQTVPKRPIKGEIEPIEASVVSWIPFYLVLYLHLV